MIAVTNTIALSEDEIEESFIRSPGPGGQNVNKVATAVQLRFDAANCPSLPEAVFARLAGMAGGNMTKDGVIIITARRFRTQIQNRRDAMDRLLELIRQAARPVKVRRPTRSTLASKRRRLEGKRRRATLKKTRAKGRDEE